MIVLCVCSVCGFVWLWFCVMFVLFLCRLVCVRDTFVTMSVMRVCDLCVLFDTVVDVLSCGV